MYRFRLRTWIYRKAILVVTAFLTWFTVQSWSQNAFGKYHDLLNLALILIAINFYETAISSSNQGEQMYKIGKLNIRWRHLCFFTSFSFLGIILFPLESELFPNEFHYVATGLGVLGLALLVSGWYKTFNWMWWSFNIALVTGAVLLVSSFLKMEVPWQVGHAEFWFVLVGLTFFETIKEH